MRSLKYLILMGAFVTIFTTSCDNEESVDPSVKEIFVKYYGEEGDQEGVALEILSDGYLLIGNSTPTGGKSEIFVAKTDFYGNREYYNYIRPQEDEAIVAVDAAVNQNGELFILAHRDPENNSDIYIAKFAAGSAQMTDSVTYEDYGNRSTPSSLTITSTGEIIVTGYTNDVDRNKPTGINDVTDILTLRFDADLNISMQTWREKYGQNGKDEGIKTVEIPGGFITLATSEFSSSGDQGGTNIITFKTQSNGFVTEGFKAYGGLSEDLARDIAPTADGGFVVLGNAETNGEPIADNHPVIIRMNATNDFVQDSILLKREIIGKSIIEANSGGYLISGTWENASENSIYVARISNTFEIEWENLFGIFDGNFGSRVKQTSDESVLILGTINLEEQTKMCLIKTNSRGELRP